MMIENNGHKIHSPSYYLITYINKKLNEKETLSANRYLRKEYNAIGTHTFELPKEFVSLVKEVNVDKILDKPYGDVILEFLEVMNSVLPLQNKTLLFNNIESLKVEESNMKILNRLLCANARGRYNSKFNKIYLSKNCKKRTITHELMHMASGYYNNNENNKSLKFVAFNEGCTEYLNAKYFNNNKIGSYYDEVNIAKKVFKIIGMEKIEDIYFNKRYDKVVTCLNEYMDNDDIIKFFDKMNFILNYKNNNKRVSIDLDIVENVIECRKENNLFLVECYAKKIILRNPNVSFDIILNEIINFSSSLPKIQTKKEEKLLGYIYEDNNYYKLVKDVYDDMFFSSIKNKKG